MQGVESKTRETMNQNHFDRMMYHIVQNMTSKHSGSHDELGAAIVEEMLFVHSGHDIAYQIDHTDEEIEAVDSLIDWLLMIKPELCAINASCVLGRCVSDGPWDQDRLLDAIEAYRNEMLQILAS